MKKYGNIGLLCCLLTALSAKSQDLKLGASTAGVQMGIAVTNNSVRIGTANTVTYLIRNASTNGIALPDSGSLEDDFSAVRLVDPAGNKQDLRPHVPMRAVFRAGSILIEPGDSYKGKIVIKPADDILPGTYSLQAKRPFRAFESGRFTGKQEVTSNLLKVTVER